MHLIQTYHLLLCVPELNSQVNVWLIQGSRVTLDSIVENVFYLTDCVDIIGGAGGSVLSGVNRGIVG